MPRATAVALLLPALLMLWGGGGCSSSQTLPPLVLPPAVAPTPTEFPAAAAILSGFDLAGSRDAWNIGDRALMAIRASRASGVTTRFLLVELTAETEKDPMVFITRDGQRGPFTLESPVAVTRLTLFDESGAKVEEANGKFATKFLGFGVYDGASVFANHPEMRGDPKNMPPLTDAEFDHSMRGWLTLMAFSGSMNKRGMFKEMMKDTVARPTWLAMIFNPSVALTFTTGDWPAHGEPWIAASGISGLPTVSLPLQLTIAGKPAMMGTIKCAEPAAPLSLCGGLIYAKGWNPENPAISVEIILLATQRGTGGRVFTETAPK